MTPQEHVNRHNSYMRKGLNLDGLGLEIGASYFPVCAKRDGYRIKTLDVESKEELVRKYTADPIVRDYVNNIEDVDYIWHGEKYSDLINEKFDYIIAGNVIEHSIDLIKFLNGLEDILQENGTISLGVPDKRFSFDIFREVTGIRTVLDVHQLNINVHPVGVHIDFALHNAFYPGTGHSIPVDFYHKTEKIIFDKDYTKIRDILHSYDETKFIDQHGWVFTPTSFRILLKELYALNLTNLVEDSYDVIEDSMEFYVKLKIDKRRERSIDKEEYLRMLIMRQDEEFMILNFAHKFISMCKELSEKQRQYFIYGAGQIGGYLLDLLAGNGLSCEGIVISDGYNKPNLTPPPRIFSFSEFKSQAPKNCSVILGVSREYQDDIIENLHNEGFENIVKMSDLLTYTKEDNYESNSAGQHNDT